MGKVVLKVYILITLALAMSAHAQKKPEVKPSKNAGDILLKDLVSWNQLQAKLAGGVSDGGGDILPNNPVSKSEIKYIVESSKQELRLILKGHQFMELKKEELFYKKIYNGKITIFEILDKVKFNILMNKPCIDFKGNEVDGSISTKSNNTVCISAFRIAPKLSQERARFEVLSLVIHEISHFLKTTESEADSLQADVKHLLSMTTRLSGKRHIDDISDSIMEVRTLSGIYNEIGLKPLELISTKVDYIYNNLDKYWQLTYNYPYSIYNRAEYDFDVIMGEQFFLTSCYLISEVGLDEDSVEFCKEFINTSFQDDQVISYKVFYERANKEKYDGLFGEYKVAKINDLTDLKREIHILFQYYDSVHAYVRSFRLGKGELPKIKLPTQN